VRQGTTISVFQPLRPNEQVAADAGVGVLTQEQLQALRFRVDGARVVE
jgi:hypothetical protein